MASRALFAVVVLALIASTLAAGTVSHSTSSKAAAKAALARSSLASVVKFLNTKSPHFAKVFQSTRAPEFLLANFEKHAYKFTLFYPTDAALKRYRPKGACAKIPMSDILAQLMVPKMFASLDLLLLKRGYTFKTMSPVYLRKLGSDKKGRVQIGIVNGYQKIVSWATVVKTDAVVNKRSFVLHQIDNIIINCDPIIAPQ